MPVPMGLGAHSRTCPSRRDQFQACSRAPPDLRMELVTRPERADSKRERANSSLEWAHSRLRSPLSTIRLCKRIGTLSIYGSRGG